MRLSGHGHGLGRSSNVALGIILLAWNPSSRGILDGRNSSIACRQEEKVASSEDDFFEIAHAAERVGRLLISALKLLN